MGFYRNPTLLKLAIAANRTGDPGHQAAAQLLAIVLQTLFSRQLANRGLWSKVKACWPQKASTLFKLDGD
jgi:hypothetical protein